MITFKLETGPVQINLQNYSIDDILILITTGFAEKHYLRDKRTKGWGICNRGECLANDHKVSVSNHSFRLQDSCPLPPPLHFFTSNR